MIEKGYDGSDNAKIKGDKNNLTNHICKVNSLVGNRIDNQEIRRNAFLTNKVVEFDQK